MIISCIITAFALSCPTNSCDWQSILQIEKIAETATFSCDAAVTITYPEGNDKRLFRVNHMESNDFAISSDSGNEVWQYTNDTIKFICEDYSLTASSALLESSTILSSDVFAYPEMIIDALFPARRFVSSRIDESSFLLVDMELCRLREIVTPFSGQEERVQIEYNSAVVPYCPTEFSLTTRGGFGLSIVFSDFREEVEEDDALGEQQKRNYDLNTDTGLLAWYTQVGPSVGGFSGPDGKFLFRRLLPKVLLSAICILMFWVLWAAIRWRRSRLI